MKVKALKKLLYSGEIYDAGTIFEMDEISAAISQKYNNVEILGGVEVADEGVEPCEGLPPLIKKKK